MKSKIHKFDFLDLREQYADGKNTIYNTLLVAAEEFLGRDVESFDEWKTALRNIGYTFVIEQNDKTQFTNVYIPEDELITLKLKYGF